MKLDKAWPDLVPKMPSEDTLNIEKKEGAKVFPKSLVDSTVEKSLKELLNQSFDLEDLEKDSQETQKDKVIYETQADKPKNKKKLKDKKLLDHAFEIEKTLDKPEEKNIQKHVNILKKDKNPAQSVESESIKYIWIALGSFCLLAFLFLNSILSKLKNLENLISRQTKVLTN